MKYPHFILILSCALLLMSGCSENTSLSTGPGTGSETTNGFTARVLYSSNAPAANVTVRLIDTGWTGEARILASTLTGPDGRVSFDSLDQFRFNVQIDGEEQGLVLRNVVIDTGALVSLDDFRLKPYGTLRGSLGNAVVSPMRVWVEGTTYGGLADSDGSFIMAGIPEGLYTLHIEYDSSGNTGSVPLEGISVRSGVTADVDTVLHAEQLLDPGLVITVKQPDGTPVPGAAVKLINPQIWMEHALALDSTIIDSGFTDANGIIRFGSMEIFNINIQVRSGSGGAFIADYALSPGKKLFLDSLEVTLQPWGSFSANIVSPGADIAWLLFKGTSMKRVVTGSAEANIHDLPPGSYEIFALFDSSGTYELAPFDTITIASGDTVTRDYHLFMEKALLVENFDDGNDQNALAGPLYEPGLADYGKWAIWRNLDPGNVLPAGVFDDFSLGLSSKNSYIGMSLGLEFWNPDSNLNTGVEMEIADFGVNTDLSALQSAVFYARGSGRGQFLFHTDTVGLNEGPFLVEFDIPADWRRIVINASDIIPEPGSITEGKGTTWDDAKTGVDRISFRFLENAEIRIDEIYFVGVEAGDL